MFNLPHCFLTDDDGIAEIIAWPAIFVTTLILIFNIIDRISMILVVLPFALVAQVLRPVAVAVELRVV